MSTIDTLSKENLESVFRACDIRGRDPEEFDSEFFYKLGQAFVKFTNGKRLAVGYDFRRSSKLYRDSLVQGILSMGCDVIGIGLVGTEMLYFSVGNDPELDGGITITASHNPQGWNGAKLVGKGTEALDKEYGLKEIKEIMLEGDFAYNGPKGKVITEDIYPDYRKMVLSFLEGVDLSGMKVIVDAGNGIGGHIFDYIFKGILEHTPMYFEMDDSFPHHVPNPIEIENVEELIEQVKQGGYDLGIALDGDGDRAFFIDSTGRNPQGVQIGSVLAEYFLNHSPGDTIVQDPRITRPIHEIVEKYKGKAVYSKSGHSFFKRKMKQEDAIFGAENSSHFYYRDFFHADSGMITVAILLKLLASGMDLKAKLDYIYTHFPVSGEVNYEIESSKEVLAKVHKYFKANHSNAQIDNIDGLSVNLGSWRFNLRGSNNEPLMRLNIEADNEGIIVENFKLLEGLIGGKRHNKPALKALQ